MRAADTNVLIRLATYDNPRQTQTAAAFVERGAWVPLLVLAEFAWVLAGVYGFDRERIALAVEFLLGNEQLSIQDADMVEAALALFRSRAATSFPDCLILESARKAGHLPLATFDRDLAKLDGAELLKSG